MASKGREVLRGLAGLAGELLGGDAAQLVDVADRFGGLLERAAAKAPRKSRAKAPPKRPALELVERVEEPPAERPVRQVAAGVVEAEHRPAARGARAVEVVVRPARR